MHHSSSPSDASPTLTTWLNCRCISWGWDAPWKAGCKSEVETLHTNWGKSAGGNYPEVFVDCSPPVFSGFGCVVGDCFTTCTESKDLQGVIDSRQVWNSNSFFSTRSKWSKFGKIKLLFDIKLGDKKTRLKRIYIFIYG